MNGKGVEKSESCQQLLDTARKNLTWHSYSNLWRFLGEVIRGGMITRLRSKDVLKAVGMLAQSTEEQ